MRRAGASYEEIAKAGGGIASTVARRRPRIRRGIARAEPPPPACADARRLHDGRGEVRLRARSDKRTAAARRSPAELGEGEAVRIVPTLLALHALPADQRDRRAHYVSEIVDKLHSRGGQAGARDQRRCVLRNHRLHARRGRARCSRRPRTTAFASGSTRSNCRTSTAPRSPPDIGALSADHLEHLDEAGAKAMAAAGTVAVLLPGAFYALHEKQEAAGRRCCAKHKVPIADRDRLQPRHLAAAVADAGDEHGLHAVRPDAGGSACRDDHQRRARARASPRDRQHRAGKAADLCVWRIESPGRARLLDRPAGAGTAHLRGEMVARRRAGRDRLLVRSLRCSFRQVTAKATMSLRRCGRSLASSRSSATSRLLLAMTVVAAGRASFNACNGRPHARDPARRGGLLGCCCTVFIR